MRSPWATGCRQPVRSARAGALAACPEQAGRDGQAGDRCALNLAGQGISKEAIRRGDMVVDPRLHAPTDRIDARLRVLPTEAKPIGQWSRCDLHHAAAEVGARIVLLDDEPIAPGESADVQLVLDRPIAAAAPDPLRHPRRSAQRTLGGGRFIDLRAPAPARRTPERTRRRLAMGRSIGLSRRFSRAPPGLDFTRFGANRADLRRGKDHSSRVLEGLSVRMEINRVFAGTLALFATRCSRDRGLSRRKCRIVLDPNPPHPRRHELRCRQSTSPWRKLGPTAPRLGRRAVRLPSHRRNWRRGCRLGDDRTAARRGAALPRRRARPRGDDRTRRERSRRVLVRVGGWVGLATDARPFLRPATLSEIATIVAEVAAAAQDGSCPPPRFATGSPSVGRWRSDCSNSSIGHGVTSRERHERRVTTVESVRRRYLAAIR